MKDILLSQPCPRISSKSLFWMRSFRFRSIRSPHRPSSSVPGFTPVRALYPSPSPRRDSVSFFFVASRYTGARWLLLLIRGSATLNTPFSCPALQGGGLRIARASRGRFAELSLDAIPKQWGAASRAEEDAQRTL